MAEKPILFNAEMVRAILAGRKTVTRRVVKPQPNGTFDQHWGGFYEDNEWVLLKEPYLPGDILWVRETWGYDKNMWIYRADFSDEDLEKIACITKWHPSIHMPREAARIWLRVTDVRVERLQTEFFKQESTIFELLAEGIDIGETCRECISAYGRPCCNDEDAEYGSECGMLDDVRDDFARLWDSTIKPADRDRYGWGANPWVWVIAFECCEKPEDA